MIDFNYNDLITISIPTNKNKNNKYPINTKPISAIIIFYLTYLHLIYIKWYDVFLLTI